MSDEALPDDEPELIGFVPPTMLWLMSIAAERPPASLSRLQIILILIGVACVSALPVFSGALALIVSQLLIDGPLLLAWIGACFGIGSGALQLGRSVARKDPNDSPASAVLMLVTRIAVGMGLLSGIVLLLGSIGCFSQAVAVVVLIAANVSTVAAVYRHQVNIRDFLRGAASLGQISLALSVPIVAGTFVGALVVPWILWGDEPHAYDVVSYHFQLPREWLELGQIGATPHNVFGYFPLNVEMQYLLAMTLHGSAAGGMYLAQLMHATMMLLTLGAIYGAARGCVGARPASTGSSPKERAEAADVHGSGKPDALRDVRTNRSRFRAATAVVFAAAFPWLMMLGSVGYNECGVMLFTALALAWTLRRRWLLAGCAAGFAAGCKITSVPTLALLLPAIVLVESFTRRRFEWRGVALLVLGAMLTLSPWLIRTAVLANGNPFFPIATRSLGSAHFDEGMVERFEVAHSARPDQQSSGGRFAALNEQVLRDFKFGSTSFGAVSVPILLLLIVPAFLLQARDRVAWMLVAFIVGNVLVWLFATHLQGRFLVPIIPAAALLIGRVKQPRWPLVVLIASAASLPLTFASVYRRLAAPAAQSGIAFSDPSVFLPEPLARLLQSTDRPVYLVGDARAFLYPVPTARLHYRSVFDVSSAKPFKDAWLGKSPESDAIVVVAPSELERFEKTYRNLPEMPEEWRGRGMFVTDVAFKTLLPME